MDTIQRVLAQCHTDPNGPPKPDIEDCFQQLCNEWRPQIRKFLLSPSAEEIQDTLQSALLQLALPASTSPPRAMAPRDATNPRAWRRTVLKNWLKDTLRGKRRRDHAQRGVAQEWSPSTEKQEWRRERNERAGVLKPNTSLTEREAPRTSGIPSDDVSVWLDSRRQLIAMIPTLPVRRRVLLLLALNGDPTPFADDLAALLDEDPSDVLARIHHATSSPHDGGHDYLSEAMVRVVYPPPKPLDAAKEAARKALANTIRDLRTKRVT